MGMGGATLTQASSAPSLVQRPRLGQVLVVDVLCEPGRDRWNEEKARQEGARVRVRVRVRVRASGIDFERFFIISPNPNLT